nr:unnamed protein product [Callosobruchus chinensis]
MLEVQYWNFTTISWPDNTRNMQSHFRSL